MNAIELVEKFVLASKAQNQQYGDSRALGATKAMLYTAVEIIDKVIKAFDHDDAISIVADMRFPVMDCKCFLKYLEEQANV